jgi:homoserine/homoserine lactone efflux protein
MDFTLWLTFFAAAWAISLSPGPGAIAAMSAGLNHGFARGYATTLGLVLGIWVQLSVVGLGLGALIATSSIAFEAVRWAGVAYLVWLGIRQWRAPAGPLGAVPDRTDAEPLRARVLRGLLINAINPKGTVFMLAVVPQFLDLSAPLLPQYAVIGLTLAFTDLVVMAGYTAFAARVLAHFGSAAHVRTTNRVLGALFMLAGLLLAAFRRS